MKRTQEFREELLLREVTGKQVKSNEELNVRAREIQEVVVGKFEEELS